jgi:hypothetical protein
VIARVEDGGMLSLGLLPPGGENPQSEARRSSDRPQAYAIFSTLTNRGFSRTLASIRDITFWLTPAAVASSDWESSARSRAFRSTSPNFATRGACHGTAVIPVTKKHGTVYAVTNSLRRGGFQQAP